MTTSIKKILINYIDDAVRKGAFVGDKGVVEVVRYLNENGRPSWLIKTTIDDSYKDNPPVEWASLESDIILFYDTNSSSNDVIKHKPTPELLRCLDDAIKDRLYIRPTRRERLVDSGFTTPARKPIIIKTRRISTSNSIVIVFEADGSITKYQPV
ncbi:hypothetical protein EXU85_31495 [Spirosoma sp. KCTC 42546]|uniref:hypothetical protein n=1 Tax=Spirosoma sp. KCTC 42546 TaxID=2520506 RepID=UPI001159DE30|nr:hypothetical protein [Spirosoma sp. KCTC 42546]QDK82887.1 hypothetical protein EXU85_31495 [Spirosoma sp. KCTC 42546]